MMRNNPDVDFVCRTRRNDFRGYADHIGFFQHMGFLRGNQPGVAFGSSNYLPIQHIDVNLLKESSGDRPYAEVVEEKTVQLAEVLTQCDKGGAYDAIQYTLREIVRNSVEHSMGNSIILFGQFWPAKEQAEIVIYDNGIGVRDAITETGENMAETTDAALRLALRPGITGVSKAEREYQHENWRNSGFGLYVTSRFCAERGIFRVISGDSGLTLNQNGATKHDWSFEGTCIQMKLNTSDLAKSGTRILEIVEEGEIESGFHGKSRNASKSSKTVGSKSI